MLDPPGMPTEQFPESNQSIVVSPAPAFEVVGPVGSAPPGKTKPSRRRRLWLWLLILLLLGLGAYFLWSKIAAKQSADAGGENPATSAPPIPTGGTPPPQGA